MPYYSDMANKVTHVYRLYDEDQQLLYVGVSNQAQQRVGHHRRRQPWGHLIAGATFERFLNRREAFAAERAAILQEKPIHNIARPVEAWF